MASVLYDVNCLARLAIFSRHRSISGVINDGKAVVIDRRHQAADNRTECDGLRMTKNRVSISPLQLSCKSSEVDVPRL